MTLEGKLLGRENLQGKNTLLCWTHVLLEFFFLIIYFLNKNCIFLGTYPPQNLLFNTMQITLADN